MKPIYKIMFFFSIALVLAAIIATAIFGLRFGVDFEGGSVIELEFSNVHPEPAEVLTVIGTANIGSNLGTGTASPTGEHGLIIRLNEINEETHQAILKTLNARYGKVAENRFASVGPTVGNELRRKSITAMVVLLMAIVIYISFVFRKMSRVLSSWAMGAAAIVALLHDVLIPIGIFALLGYYQSVEVSAVFVAAILTILGYSVSDTVVVFDRVRENVLRFGSTEGFGRLVHKSVLQTLSRSLNTTFTTLLSLIAIFLFGGETVKYFALALIIGIFLGAYSSIFVASPILVWASGRGRSVNS